MIWIKKGMLLLFILVGSSLVFGCSAKQTRDTIGKSEEVVIPVIFTVDPNSGEKKNKELVDVFNKEYDGKYHVQVEWIMETEEEYRQNLKRLNVSDQLPAVITDLRMLPSFYQRLIEDNRIVDLAPYIEADKEWQEAVDENVLESCTEEDGSVYLSSTATSLFSCSGVFWNKELFEQAGITEFPNTWEAFWQTCDSLAAAGITPLALHTEGTAWAPMLFTTAKLAESEEGLAYLKTVLPDTYQNVYGFEMAETLKKLFQYTTEDAMYSDFDVSYRNFFSGKAAMIPNGYWMISQMDDEWKEKAAFSAFPENILISSPETFGWAVVAGYDEEVKEGAIEFLKFRVLESKKERDSFLGIDSKKLDSVSCDYRDTFQKHEVIAPNYQVKWNSILQEDTLGEQLPPLIEGKITSQEFTQYEDESIIKYESEQ